MKRILQWLLITVGLGGGLVAVAATAAHAGENLNHSEPVIDDRNRRNSSHPRS